EPTRSAETGANEDAFMNMRWMGAALVALMALAGCGGGQDSDRLRVAYVTNGIDPFWTIAAAGANAAGRDLDVDVEVLMPPKGLVDQKRMMETVLANGIDGIAVSPIDAENQVQFLNEAAKATILITQDSDAPNSDRL